MRDGTGHAPDGRELLGLQQIALALQQAGAHAVEGTSQLGDFVASARIERMMKVSAFESADARHQTAQRPRKGMRNEKHQPAADHDGRQSQQQEIPVQFFEEFCCLVVGSEDAQADGRGSRARQLQRCRQKPFFADLDIARLFPAPSR